MKSAIILLLLSFVNNLIHGLKDNSDLIAVVQVFRHGQRTPVSFYSTDPYANRSNWPVNPGQLTNEGKRQHYNLGKYTRQRYSDFLSTTYSNEDFFAQTTDVDRTHMSAQCFLAGLYTPNPDQEWNPDLKWQPIPVHPMDDKIFSAGFSCPVFLLTVANIIINDPFFAALNKNYSEVYRQLTLNSEDVIFTVAGASGIYDTLHIEDLFGFKLPEWTTSVYPEPLKYIAGNNFQSFGYNDRLKRLSAGVWLHTILRYFDTIIKNPSSIQKYQVFSGHDTNIATILSTFGIVKPTPPNFASTIYVELRNVSDVGAVINVWHKNGGDDIEAVQIQGCDLNCKLDDFKEIMKIWEVDAETWSKECYTKIDQLVSREEELTKILLEEFFRTRSPVKYYN